MIGEGAYAGGWVATVTPAIEDHIVLIVNSSEAMAVQVVPAADREKWIEQLKDDE